MVLRNLKIIAIALGLTAIPFFTLKGVSLAAGDPAKGKAIFEGVCIACHGQGGNAMIPGVPSFAKNEAAKGEKLSDRTDAQLKESIKNGFPNPSTPGAPPMPPYGGGAPLDDQQLSDLIAYIRSLAK